VPGKTKWSFQNGIGSALARPLAGPDQVHAAGDRLVRLVVRDRQGQQALAGSVGHAGRRTGRHGDPEGDPAQQGGPGGPTAMAGSSGRSSDHKQL